MLRRANPAKRFHELSPYAICRNMKETTLARLAWSLTEERHEITVPPDVLAGAERALRRMLELSGADGTERTTPKGPVRGAGA